MGAVVEGVVGYRRPQYNIWGPAVDMARKLELTGKMNHIQVSYLYLLSLTYLRFLMISY
jgi:hypothetical protein